MYVKLSVFRGSPLEEVFSARKMLCKHETNLQENSHAEVWSQQSSFSASLKSHLHMDVPPKGMQHTYRSLTSRTTLVGDYFCMSKEF